MDLWDNGMYTKCKILNETFTFLVDNGSTASLMSKRAYDQIDHLQKPKLIETQNKLKGADDKPIKLYCKMNVPIILYTNKYWCVTLYQMAYLDKTSC
ncbi:hypothetical protein DPMN_051992 [Dreissena polymorpha]|uniref:Uncharacterized protein n=1 Tax=Dreissena polymorpha TaxID=45954 RepID=A0A9D4CK18_DREPO|nr:hypothetical protein DPMN_051992 [Dreissena polymorpha]